MEGWGGRAWAASLCQYSLCRVGGWQRRAARERGRARCSRRRRARGSERGRAVRMARSSEDQSRGSPLQPGLQSSAADAVALPQNFEVCPGVSALASSVPSRSTPGHFGPLQPLGALAAPRERPRPAPDEYRLGSAGFGRFSACHTLPARPRGLGSMIILSVFNDAISIVGARSPLILRAAPRSSMPCAHLVDRDIG